MKKLEIARAELGDPDILVSTKQQEFAKLANELKECNNQIKVLEAPLLDDDGLITKGYNFRNIIGHPARKTVVLSLT